MPDSAGVETGKENMLGLSGAFLGLKCVQTPKNQCFNCFHTENVIFVWNFDIL